MDAPSMVQSSIGGTLIVRNLVSGDQMVINPTQNNESLEIVNKQQQSPASESETDRITSNLARNEDQSSRNSSISNNSSSSCNNNKMKINNNNNESNSATIDVDEPGLEDDSETNAQLKKDETKLPQCKIKRNYSCNNCNYFTQNPRRFLMHLRDTHGEKININECKLCLYASRHYQKLVRHMRMVHGSTEGINEPTQSRRPRTSLKLKRTSQLQEDPDLMIDEPHFIPSVIDMQVPGDTGPRLEKCSMCSFTALSHDSLKAHEREDHAQTKFFRCSRCNYVTHIRARYSKHIKYHSMPMIKCHLCDFRTPYKWNLDRHMKNHGGQGPFKCSACTFSADIKQSLTVHETNHHIPPIGGHTASDLVPQLHDWPEDLSMSSSHNSQEDEEIPLDYTVAKSPDLSDNQGGETSNSDGSYRKKARPIPSLIPINETFNAFKNIPKANEASAMAAVDYLNEIYLKTIKSITMLFGNEEQQQNNNNSNQNLPVNSTAQDEDDSSKAINKKTLSIFEKLKEKINLGQIDDENLVCTCGYQAKSLSDIFMHQNICKIKSQSQETNNPEPERNCESVASSHSPTLSSIFSSTRCQYCRHRCKSTDDLLLHLKTCVEAQQQDGAGSDAGSDVKCEKLSTTGESSGSADEAPIDNPLEAPPSGINWIPNNATAAMQMAFMDQILSHNIEVVSENNNGGDVMVVDRPKKSGMGFPKKSPFVSMKKVFKCPHCSFWASTASRFHVHIVGHLNKKPFECSLCAYRSNWRWDITKHIRLKTVRDSNHKTARVLMNDETGRRNYTKYNKYITLMGVNDSDTNVKQSKVDDSILLQHHEQQARENGGTPTPMDISNPYLASALSFGKSSSHNTNDENHLSDNDSNNCNKKTHFKCKKCSFKSYDRDEVLGHVKQHYIDAGLLITSAAANANQKPLIQIPPPKLDIMSHFLEPTQSRIVSNLMQVMPDITIKTPPLFPLPNGETSITTAQSSDDPISVLNTDQITILTKNNNNNNQVASNSPRNKENVLQLGQLIGGGGTGTTTTTTILNNHNNTNTNTIKINNNIINNFTPTNVTITSTSNTTTQGSSSAGLVQVQGSTTSTTTASTSTSASNNTSSNNNWRGPAPYRCGHCHQVSNWKHVIQRHCRLKHNGNISIEQLGKTNSNSGRVTSEDARSRRSRPQNTSTTNNNSNNNILTQSSNNNMFVNLNQAQIKPGSANVLEDLLKRNIEQSQQTQQQQKMDISISLEKKYKCQFCPYESNSKSQLQYHSSFHNQKSLIGDETEVFNCKYCTYTVSRRHLLLQHLKMHGNEAIEDAVDLTSEDNINQESASKTLPSPRLLYFCRHCPARYLSKPEIDHHLSMHDADHTFKCRLCTYTASTESNMQAHYTVHTTYYQEKTKEFQNKYQTSVDHQMPRIEQEVQPSTSNETKEQSWIVIAPPPLPPNLLKSLHEQKMFGLLSLLTKCKFCGFNADTPDALQLHLVHHKRFSGKEFPYKCEHCDFSTTTIPLLTEHLKPHFLFIQNSRSDLMKINNNNNNNGPPSTANENGKSIAFYTNYDNLELKCVDLRKIKQENAMEVNEEFESDFIYNENSDLALKQKLLEMISNVSNKDKIIVRLD
uniref:CSON006454 protein n=1 Tax=Culicoides sonorensis TaxID=179676 RepID=A0A336MSB2_CULSO